MLFNIPVSTNHIQEQIFNVFDINFKLILYFNSLSKGWQFDLFDIDNDFVITQRQGLAINSPSLIGKHLPFVLVLIDIESDGVNSLSRFDLGNRLELYLIEKEVWFEAIREKI